MLGSRCSSRGLPEPRALLEALGHPHTHPTSGTPIRPPATPTPDWLRPPSPVTQEAAGPLPDPWGPPLPSKQIELEESGK